MISNCRWLCELIAEAFKREMVGPASPINEFGIFRDGDNWEGQCFHVTHGSTRYRVTVEEWERDQ